VGIVPDVALVSSATRTRQTWEILAATANYTVEPVLSGEIYRAYVEELLEELRAVDPAAQRVLLVGHEPAISATAYKLAGTGSNPEAVARVRRGVPTAAHAIIQPGGPWESLGYEPSMLAAVITPLI
jgi:phosphohistidine phosphatase